MKNESQDKSNDSTRTRDQVTELFMSAVFVHLLNWK